ncbi:MAG: hypothetical protein SOR61_01690 [Evtepia sp.]|uniref:hypothetical protein n=1 Tax=Evtepia sp. TaxID=2773933 RepID=UPI002A758B6E|nr:hypothetical protein [Evtepia sp.]MDY3013910.1 hypothetical protein [Evtepia sp.]
MDKRGWDPEQDRNWETMIEERLPSLPPEDMVQEVTPWRRSMNRVLVGLALRAFNVQLLGLQYLLPLAGTLLVLLGFRALRGENRWFRRGFWVSVGQMAFLLVRLTLLSTIWWQDLPGPVEKTLVGGELCLTLALAVCLWEGLLEVLRKAGREAKAPGGGMLVVWYLALYGLAIAEYQGLLLGLLMVLACALVLRSLYRLSKVLEETGYGITPVPVRVPDWQVAGGVLAVLAVGLALGYLLGGTYPMQWQPLQTQENVQVAQEKDRLLQLGFPADVLNDLTDQEILACQGAVRVVVQEEDFSMNPWGETSYREVEGQVFETAYDQKELRLTGVAVELPGEPARWRVFHHFRWTLPPAFRGTESIQLTPVYQRVQAWGRDEGEVTGRLLCDRDGQRYTAPYYRLEQITYTSGGFFGGEYATWFAAFSLPRERELPGVSHLWGRSAGRGMDLRRLAGVQPPGHLAAIPGENRHGRSAKRIS